LFDLKKDFPIFHTGVAGVILFFLISGYIMPQAIIRCANFKDFLMKRSIRIYPLLIAVMIYGLLRYGAFKEKMLLGLILPFADFMNGMFVVKGVDWTLRVEFFYYVLMGLIYFKSRFHFKSIILCIAATSTLIFLTYFHTENYFNYRLIYLNFIFLGSLLYLIEEERFKVTKHNIFTFIAMIFSIFMFESFRLDPVFLFPGLLLGVSLFLFLYFIHQTKFQIKSNQMG
jgi:peptidoglycan/LPS O-acetylase OafA/YrhL